MLRGRLSTKLVSCWFSFLFCDDIALLSVSLSFIYTYMYMCFVLRLLSFCALNVKPIREDRWKEGEQKEEQHFPLLHYLWDVGERHASNVERVTAQSEKEKAFPYKLSCMHLSLSLSLVFVINAV